MSRYQVLCWDCNKPINPDEEHLVRAGHPATTRGNHAVCAACALKRKPINYGGWNESEAK